MPFYLFFSKILEKIIYHRLYDILQNKNILTDDQFGFRKKYSTSLAIFNLTESVLKEMEKGNFCIGLFMDLSKAFDTIDHHILLNKLEYYGVRGIALQWFSIHMMHRLEWIGENWMREFNFGTCLNPRAQRVCFRLFPKLNECIQFH